MRPAWDARKKTSVRLMASADALYATPTATRRMPVIARLIINSIIDKPARRVGRHVAHRVALRCFRFLLCEAFIGSPDLHHSCIVLIVLIAAITDRGQP